MHATRGTLLCFLWIYLHILFAFKDMVSLQNDMLHHHHAVPPRLKRSFLAPRKHCAISCGLTGVPAAGGEHSWEFKKSPLNKEKVFDMGHIWTFHMHQHIVDLSTFNMQILKQFDITHYLNGQPLQSMIKDRWAAFNVITLVLFCWAQSSCNIACISQGAAGCVSPGTIFCVTLSSLFWHPCCLMCQRKCPSA